LEGQDPSTGEPEPSNEQLVVEVALAVLEGKDWIEEASDELIDTLKRLYHANPHCQIEVKFTGDVLHDVLAGRPGEILVASFEQECDEHWEREQAERWSCPCGVTFGLYPFSERTVAFYTLADTGLFEQAVTHCLRCTRDLKRVREQHADGQLGFAF
jgi:hypothetical protein